MSVTTFFKGLRASREPLPDLVSENVILTTLEDAFYASSLMGAFLSPSTPENQRWNLQSLLAISPKLLLGTCCVPGSGWSILGMLRWLLNTWGNFTSHFYRKLREVK